MTDDPERCEIDWGPVPPVCKIHGTRVWECFAKLSSELDELRGKFTELESELAEAERLRDEFKEGQMNALGQLVQAEGHLERLFRWYDEKIPTKAPVGGIREFLSREKP